MTPNQKGRDHASYRHTREPARPARGSHSRRGGVRSFLLELGRRLLHASYVLAWGGCPPQPKDGGWHWEDRVEPLMDDRERFVRAWERWR